MTGLRNEDRRIAQRVRHDVAACTGQALLYVNRSQQGLSGQRPRCTAQIGKAPCICVRFWQHSSISQRTAWAVCTAGAGNLC
jgi:hypothetical protein